MRILDSTKSLSVLVNDNTNGLGTIQPLECTVTEELNGIYECEFTVLTTDKHYEDLKSNGLIKVKVGNGSEQIFRVYFISEPINFVVSVKAQHITYDLSKIVVKPFTATGAVNIKNQLVSHMLGSYPFTTWTDIENTTSTFKLDIPRSFRECLGGYEGSVLDVLRCEYEWDNLTVKLHARRGMDHGVRIAYGKNLTDFVQEQNNENVFDAVYGFAVIDETTYQATRIFNKTGASTPKVLCVDFSSSYDTDNLPTPADLLAKATTYAQNNPIEVPNVNIKIDFVPLWQTEEYKDILQLERVSMGDTVHVFFDKLNVEASARVIKTVWNVLTQKYDSIELGDAKANLNTVINSSIQEAVDSIDLDFDIDVGWLDEKLENITTLIANGLGLHITQDEAGRIILHNAETIADSQYQYMITAQGFMLSENYGQTWSSGWTTSGDAVLNSLSTITLRALEIYGSFLRFGSEDTNYIDVAPYSINNVPQGVSFDGTGTIRMQPQEAFFVNNKAVGSSSNYNRIAMSSNSSDNNQSYISLTNYDDLHNYSTANRLYMYSHYQLNSNDMGMVNYDTSSGSSQTANSLQMSASSTSKTVSLSNRKIGATTYANMYSLVSSSTQELLYMYNYRFNDNEIANEFSMSSTSTISTIDVRNRNSGSTNAANYITLSENPTDKNTIKIYNQDSSATTQNYIEMIGSDNPVNSMMHVWSRSDLFLQSNGAVRIYSGGDQDITLNAGDDIYLTYANKLRINGNQMSFKTFTVSGTSYTALCIA